MLVVSKQKIIFLFIFLLAPFFVNASVVINEVAWMGTVNSSNDEWIELYNNSNEDVDLNGWVLKAQDDTPLINLSGTIKTKGFFLLERTDDTTVPDVPADLFYTGALLNTGEILILKNNDTEIDKVSASDGWPAGDNITKQTMQRNGNSWITADPTPKALNVEPTPGVGLEQTETITYDTAVDWPVEPQIFANAGNDKTAIAGADTYFSGQALGLKKEPLENARYLWNFGDGASAEGQNVLHTYKYPGEYIVVLNVSSGKYSASDRLIIKIIPNQLVIIEANQSYIKLHNGSNVELDISHWFLRAEGSLFKFSENTFIKANKDLTIDYSVSGLVAKNQRAELLYSNGSVAFSYSPTAVPKVISPIISEQKIIPEVVSTQNDETVENQVSDNQTANVISVAKGDSWNVKNWLFVIFGIGAISGVGLIFIRHQGSL